MQLLVPLLNRSVFQFNNEDKSEVYRVHAYGFTLGHAFYRNFSKYLFSHRATENEHELNLFSTERFSLFELKFVPFLVVMPSVEGFHIVELDGDKMFCTRLFQQGIESGEISQ